MDSPVQYSDENNIAMRFSSLFALIETITLKVIRSMPHFKYNPRFTSIITDITDDSLP